MSDPTLQAQVDAANAYEALFVPALFGQWTPTIAEAAHIQPGQRVLDVACGTGILAREIAPRVGSGGRVVGIDPSPGMIAAASQLAPAVEWQQGVAESLPFPDASFDAVVSQFGLMFFADRRQALREMIRVLNPGGRLAVAVWDSLENMPAYASEVALVDRIAGPQAADALRAPFVLGDRKHLAALCAEAGLASADVTTGRGPQFIRCRRRRSDVPRVGASRYGDKALMEKALMPHPGRHDAAAGFFRSFQADSGMRPYD